MRTIPKIVHYCWFGNGEKPQDVQKYICSWKEKMPDYTFMEWNEGNFDIEHSIPYVQQAYAARKFAFVSDYVRIAMLYQYGGIYFDTDVEVRKSFEEYLEDKAMVLGFESERSLLTAFIAVEKQHLYIKEFLDSYEERSFLQPNGEFDLTVINKGFSELLETKGLKLERNEYQEPAEGVAVYPEEYFCGFDVKNWHTAVTEKTCTVHHMASSWVPGKKGLKLKMIKLLQKLVGYHNYDKLKSMIKK